MQLRTQFELREVGDELDPQAAESEQLAMLGMHEASEDDDDLTGAPDGPGGAGSGDDDSVADPSDDLDRDGLEELEEMEKLLREEDSPLDFAANEEE